MCWTQVNSYLNENEIEVQEYSAVSSDVALLASNELIPLSVLKGTETAIKKDVASETVITGHEKEEVEGKNNLDRIWADPGTCCYALYSKLESDKVLLQQSPLALAKAIKVVNVLPSNGVLFGLF